MASSVALAQPAITGANAFWWLGSGILSDGGGCSGDTSPCYYAQAAWTANPNGASGTPTWYVTTVTGGGNVSLSCTFCANTVAASTAPSNGCTYDVTVYVTYPDGSQSGNFNVAIVAPSTLTLQGGYPTDEYWYSSYGFPSTCEWNLTDTCGNSDYSLDGNETFGGWYDVYSGNTRGYSSQADGHEPGSYWYDYNIRA